MAEPKYEDNPVLTRLIVRADGSRSVGLRVFCRRQARSFTLDYCRECPQCFEVVGEGASAVVRCKPPVGAEDHPVCPVSLDGVAVGAMLKQEVLCVSHDLPVQDLTMLVAERSLANVFVVDGDRGLVGVVRETDLLDASRRLASYTGRRTWPPGTTAASVMTRSSAVLESTPVRRALLEMAVAHVRRAPVVTPSGELVGSLGDLEGMRWLAAYARRVSC